ncbi:Alpha/Beta hydrolase protein [Myxozyma melibiosi]|uniref:Alpha/Beta hydrolase protein n=1 Tax=Myxozyma melibiosi TaxID=54550 RepID=A0ABR1F8R7_9ASCO
MTSESKLQAIDEYIPVNGIQFYTKQTVRSPGGTVVPKDTKTVAKIFFIHGFAEHVNRYTELFEVLASKGIEVFAFDQRGAGRTAPDRKDWGVTEEKLVYEDIDAFISLKMKPDFSASMGSPIPWYMMGFSMGGGICLNYAIKGNYRDLFTGYVAMSPCVLVHPRTRPNPVVHLILLGVSKVVPRLQFDTGIVHEYLTHDEAEVEALSDMLDRGKHLLDHNYYSKIADKSVLIIHGDADKVNSFDASKLFFERLPIKNKHFVVMEGGYHELHHERPEDRQKFFKELIDWFYNDASRISTASSKL